MMLFIEKHVHIIMPRQEGGSDMRLQSQTGVNSHLETATSGSLMVKNTYTSPAACKCIKPPSGDHRIIHEITLYFLTVMTIFNSAHFFLFYNQCQVNRNLFQCSVTYVYY